jgi:hypothetical protein
MIVLIVLIEDYSLLCAVLEDGNTSVQQDLFFRTSTSSIDCQIFTQQNA